MPKTIHISKYTPDQGGMDYLLRLHQENDEVTHHLLQGSSKIKDSINEWIPLCLQSRKLRRHAGVISEFDASIYYNCWGADLITPRKPNHKRIGYLHNHFPNFEIYIKYFSQYLDGFLTVNPATTDKIISALNNSIVDENIQTINLPINPPSFDTILRKEKKIGLAGRINYEQKRFDRLPALANELQLHLPQYKIEVMGTGPNSEDLKKKTQHLRNITFLEWQTGEDYWRTLYKWEYILFLSDYEGLPVSLLEALQMGCKAIYPDFHNGHKQGLPIHLYEPGNIESAVNRIKENEFITSENFNYVHRSEDYLGQVANAVYSISRNRSHTKLPAKSFRSIPLYNKHYRGLTHGS